VQQVVRHGDLTRHIIPALAIGLGVLGLRLVLTLLHDGFLGVDGGAYLLHALRLTGLSLPQMDFIRPPLAPGWMLIPFLDIWGYDTGYKVWAAIFSTIPVLPATILLAWRLFPRYVVPITLFSVLNPWHWEMVITGALPLVGIGFILLALWGLVAIATGQSRWYDGLAVVGSIGIIPYINQTSTGLAAVAIPVFLLALCWQEHSFKPLASSIKWLATGALIALPAILLFYSDVRPGGSRLSFPGPILYLQIGGGLIMLTWGWMVGWLSIKDGHNHVIKALIITMLVFATLPSFGSYEESIINIFFRSQHIGSILLIMLAVPTFAGVVRLASQDARVAKGVVAVAVLILVPICAFVFDRQADYSDMVTPDMELALQHVPMGQPETIVTGNFMTGLWIAALRESPTVWTFSTKPPPYWQETYQHVQCLLGWVDGCDPLLAARTLNTRYVIIDTRFPHISRFEPNIYGAPEDTWAPTEAAPWLNLIAAEGTVRLWEVRHG